MIPTETAIEIHRILIERFGGTPGVRDRSALESALERPYQTFDQKELYPNIIDKASALLESIITNHPFVDGNKRIGYMLMRLTLMEDALDLDATTDEKYEFVISIASGELDYEGIRKWIAEKAHTS